MVNKQENKKKGKGEQLELPFEKEFIAPQRPTTDLMRAVALKAPNKRKIEKDFSPQEAAAIKQRAAERKVAQSPEAKSELEAERTRRKTIVRIKKIAKELEKNNRSRVILFPSYSRKGDKLEWYKLGELSALYYAYRMADRLGRAARVMKDTDKFAQMHAIVSVREIDKLLEQAMRLGEFESYDETVDGIYILNMKKPLTDEEIGILRRTEAERRERMHNVLKPKRADAAIYQTILTLDRQLLPRINKLSKGYFTVIGATMARQILALTHIYFKYVNGCIDGTTAKVALIDLTEGLLAGLAILGENEVWGYDVVSSIGENVNMLKKLVTELKV